MAFIFEQIRTGGDRNFSYLIGDGAKREAVVVDPSYKPEEVLDRAEKQGLKVAAIINTHGHGDHTNGNNTVQELTGADVAAYKGSFIKHQLGLEEGQVFKVGDLSLKIFHTPGHCEDHIVIYVEKFHAALTGDHLFVGKVGGTKSEAQARAQYDHLKRLYQVLPLQTTIWPGHDYGARPSSTLEMEKASNPFLMAHRFSEFSELKSNWSIYKQEKGLL